MSDPNDTNKRLDELYKIMSAPLELLKQTFACLQEMKEIQQKQLQQLENSAERNHRLVGEIKVKMNQARLIPPQQMRKW